MGFAFSWIGVRDMTPAEVFSELELEDTETRHLTPPRGFSYLVDEDAEWIYVIAFGSSELTDLPLAQAKTLSLSEDAYWFSRYDVGNYAEVAFCSDGEVKWRIEYHLGAELRDWGTLPPAVEAVVGRARRELSDDPGELQGTVSAIAGECAGFELMRFFSWDSKAARQEAEQNPPFVELLVADN